VTQRVRIAVQSPEQTQRSQHHSRPQEPTANASPPAQRQTKEQSAYLPVPHNTNNPKSRNHNPNPEHPPSHPTSPSAEATSAQQPTHPLHPVQTSKLDPAATASHQASPRITSKPTNPPEHHWKRGSQLQTKWQRATPLSNNHDCGRIVSTRADSACAIAPPQQQQHPIIPTWMIVLINVLLHCIAFAFWPCQLAFERPCITRQPRCPASLRLTTYGWNTSMPFHVKNHWRRLFFVHILLLLFLLRLALSLHLALAVFLFCFLC
jgi:hypothetical protein